VTPAQYCEAKAAGSGSSFYYAFRFLPPERRAGITALYAFCREVDDVVDEVSDPNVARQKLMFWRQELARLRDGAPNHPVGRALAPVVSRYQLSIGELETVVDGMQWDLERTRYANWDDLNEYCHRVAGVVGTMSAAIFGFVNPKTRDYAHELGMAFQLTNIIRDVGEDARRGRIYIPQTELSAFGVAPSALLRGEDSSQFQSLMKSLMVRARASYAKAFAALPPEDRKSQKPGLMMAAIYENLLNKIEQENFPVLAHRVSISPLQKLLLALGVWVRR
jgi:15-cis-phytoene synthase